ncbi:MAG: transaldolase family protein [Cyanobacteria bacterium P01_A01_bin.37]
MTNANLPTPSTKELRLFLDTADVDQWKAWMPTGMFYGITSNPLLLERASVPCSIQALTHLAHQAFALGAEEMQMQTWGNTVDDLVNTGRAIADIDQRVVVKVPITKTGTEAASQLITNGVRVTLTAAYTRHQALIAAAIGAEYVAPYLGRITDQGGNGRDELVAMQRSLDGVSSETRILTASIRQVEDLSFLSAQGLNTFTFSAAIAAALFEVPATQQATQEFEQAAKRLST